MAASNVVDKNTAAFIDFQFGMLHHVNITQHILLQSIAESMTHCLSRIHLEFNEKDLNISDFEKKANRRRVRGWISCSERDRDSYLTAFQQIMTDRTVSKLLSAKTNIKSTKIKMGQLMLKFSNDCAVETAPFENTEQIPHKYHELRNQNSYDKAIISQLQTFGYAAHDIKHAMDHVLDAKDINSIVQYMDDKNKKESAQKMLQATDFSGVWKMEQADNLDLFMKSEGYGYVSRTIMATVSMIFTIKHDIYRNVIEVKGKLPVGEIHEKLRIDGKSACDSLGPFGDKVKMTANWYDKKKKEKIVIQMQNLKSNKTITVERYMVNKHKMCETIVNESNVLMLRIFRKEGI